MKDTSSINYPPAKRCRQAHASSSANAARQVSFLLLLVGAYLWGPTTVRGRQETAVAKSPREASNEQPSDAVQRGRGQFVKACSFCHGPDANGGSTGPNLMRSSVVRHDEDGDLIGAVIRDGRPNKGMPAIQLTSGQIKDVVAFLHYRLTESDLRSPKEPSAEYSAAKLLIGRTDAGKRFFYGAGGCSACHSPAGDLAGIARKYPAAELQENFLYPQDQPLNGTVTDASGKQYPGRIRLLTNYDVAIEDAQGWYHSWPLDTVKLEVKDSLAAHLQLLSRLTDSDMHNIFAYLETLK